MGGSKNRGKGGGGAAGRHGKRTESNPKKLRRDPGVPDLRDVARKLTNTARAKSHSVMSLHAPRINGYGADGGEALTGGFGGGSSGGGGGGSQGGGRLLSGMSSAAIRSLAAERMGRTVASRRGVVGGGGGGGGGYTSSNHPFAQHHHEGGGGDGEGEDGEEAEAIRQAAQRRQMAALALRTNEKVHDYEAPMAFLNGGGLGHGTGGSTAGDLVHGGHGYGEGETMLEDIDHRGTDRSLSRFFKQFNSVVESCDVLLQVLDARDPLGCRLTKLEKTIRSSYGDKKKIVVVLNKVDMLPSKEVVDAWIHYFEEEENITCIPFAATAKGSIGQSYVHNMFCKLRELARGEHAHGNDRKAIVVGVIGYPNVGKSSIINALKRKNVVGVGNMPGFTTGNTEVQLRSDIRVMDCPGVVMPGEDNGDVVLRGAVRVSELANPFTPVARLLQRCSAVTDVDLDHNAAPDNNEDDEDGNEEEQQQRRAAAKAHAASHRIHPLAQFYGIGSLPAGGDVMEFIRRVGVRRGRLMKGGQVDEEATAKMILDDWNSGRIGYYTYPPEVDDFFSGGDFRTTGRKGAKADAAREDGGEARVMAAGHGVNANVVSSLSRGITLDGLPTFHLTMSRMAEGHGSRKKWTTAYRDQEAEEEDGNDEEYDEDEDDQEEYSYDDEDGDDDDDEVM